MLCSALVTLLTSNFFNYTLSYLVPELFHFQLPHPLPLLHLQLLSLFFLSHSPVPKLRWRKVDGLMPSKAGSSAEGPTLTLPELSFDDEGVYECEAYNSEGSDTYQGRINVQGKEKIFCQPLFILSKAHMVSG